MKKIYSYMLLLLMMLPVVATLQSCDEEEIVFDKVCFSYSRDAEVSEINMHFKKGECAVIAGESGAGKSTRTLNRPPAAPHCMVPPYFSAIMRIDLTP